MPLQVASRIAPTFAANFTKNQSHIRPFKTCRVSWRNLVKAEFTFFGVSFGTNYSPVEQAS